MTTTKNKLPVLEGIPEAQIIDLQKHHTEVMVRVQRFNAAKKLSTLPGNHRMKVADLLRMEDWCYQFAGGGDYVIYVKDPNNYANDLLKFKFSLEGQIRLPHYADTAGSPPARPQPMAVGNPRAPMQVQPGAPAPPLSPWAQGLHPEDQMSFMRHPGGYGMGPAPGATRSSDEIAIKELDTWKSRVAMLEARLESSNKKRDEDTSRLRDELAAERAAAQSARHEAQMEGLRTEIRSMRDQPVAVAEKSPWLDPAIVTAMVPALVALIQGKATSGSEALKVQADGLQSLMTATLSQANKPDSTQALLKTWGPMLIPIVQGFLSQRDPEKQAALYETMAANNLNSISMMAQLVQSMAEMTSDDRPWWAPAIQEALGGVVEATQTYASTRGGLPGQRPALPPQPIVPPRAVGVGTIPAAQPVDVVQAPQGDVERKVPDNIARMLRFVPNAFQTEQWIEILRGLHLEPPLSAEEMAEGLVGRLEEDIDKETLPAEFGSIEEFVAQPGARLVVLLEQLPVSQSRPEWVIDVARRVVQKLIEDEYADQPEAEVSEEVPTEGEEIPTVGAVEMPDTPQNALHLQTPPQEPVVASTGT